MVRDVPECLVQRLQFVQIVRQPSPIAVGIVRIGLTQRIADGPAQGHGVHRRCPDVLVVLYFLLVAIVQMPVMRLMVIVLAMFVMCVVMAALHPLGVLLPVCLHAVHHSQPVGDSLACRVQNVLHPQLAFPAVVDEHLRLADGDHVQRRGLKAVCLPPGGHQQLYVHRVPADLPHKVVVGEQRAHHVQFPALRTVLPPAARQRQRQYRRQHRCACSSHVSRLLCVSCLIKP